MEKLEQIINDIINRLKNEGLSREDMPLVLNYLDLTNSNHNKENFTNIFDLEDIIAQIEQLKISNNESSIYFLGIIKAATSLYISMRKKDIEEDNIKNEVKEMDKNELAELMDIVYFIYNNEGINATIISRNIDINELHLLQILNKFNKYFYTKKIDGLVGFYLSEKGIYLLNYFNLINEAYSLLKKKS